MSRGGARGLWPHGGEGAGGAECVLAQKLLPWYLLLPTLAMLVSLNLFMPFRKKQVVSASIHVQCCQIACSFSLK